MRDGPRTGALTVSIPVRPGRYAYVRVAPDGTTTHLDVASPDLDAGRATIDVAPGDLLVEIALSSTSDPDYERPRGTLWPRDGAA
jgi:hypothetical protein